MNSKILLVDDDEDLREMVAESLRMRSYTVEAVAEGAQALALIQDHEFDAVITDVNLAGASGIDLCASVSAVRPDLPVIMITGHGSFDTAIAAIRAGAYDFITKPILMEVLYMALQRAVNHHRLRSEVQKLRGVVEASQRMEQMIGDSPQIRRVYELIDRVAASDTSVLIIGETGTGKELVARALHARSLRKSGPFIAINCAAMPVTLLESELFGHVRGAFTDAKQPRSGLFVQAEGGTLFLDELGDMPLEMQTKLLRALQERKVRPVGGDTEVPFDVRLVTATNRDLDSAVEEGDFRRDLFYRINVVSIPLPPLRGRGNDVLLLAQHFLRKQAARTGKAVTSISNAAARKLLYYEWPGNVRELENCIERAVAMARFSEVGTEDLPDKILHHQGTQVTVPSATPEAMIPMAEMELRYMRQALAAAGGNKTQAARVLGLDRRSFYRRLARLEKQHAE